MKMSRASRKKAHRTASSAAAEWPNFSLVVGGSVAARASALTADPDGFGE
jgi:hypothetical protein